MLAVARAGPEPARATLLLLGGNEWRPGAEAADSWWLARAAHPRVTVLTSPAQDRPRDAVAWAGSYFQQLGASVEGCFIQSPGDASDPGLLSQLGQAAAVYICGGDPGAGCRVLAGSGAARVLLQLLRSGVPLAGSSAGAMLLGAHCLVPGREFALTQGVGLLPRMVVLPHWNSAGGRWRRATQELADRHQLVGIDELTGLCWDGRRWRVLGPGKATLLTTAGAVAVGRAQPDPPVE